MKLIFIALLAGFWFAARLGAQEEHVGERPYEMVWANRTEDTHPALLDFESVEGWTAETKDTVATLTRTREQQLWGKYVAKLVYRVEGERGPAVTLRPPKPVTVPGEFDCVNFWIYGNNWGWMPDASTPPVGVAALFKTTDGKDLRVSLGSVRWKEWWVMHKKLAQAVSGAQLVGIEFTNCRNKQDRALYLDNLACYKEQLPALTFEPRPKRGIEMFPGQGVGLSMGPGKLPFPTREETILPDNLTKGFKTALAQDGAAFVFKYEGDDGVLEYRYEPKTGTLGDVTAAWRGRGAAFQPMSEGGIMFATEGKAATPQKLEKLECKREGETVVSRWRATLGERTAEVTYTLRLWQKSLVVDVKCLGGLVGEFRVGRAMGVENPRLVTLPYLVCGAARPAVLVMGPADRPLFLFAMLDWYRSNASMLMAENRVAAEGVTYNGGSTYNPKTDGKRNDCFERLFLTISPRFEEVLPNIPNPKSPWMHVAGERVWRAHGASVRERDYEHWATVARYGMSKVLITDHETGWRDGGESFTVRTKAAPKKGGDEGQADYSRKIRALGFRYGIYNNYTDFASVNEHWHEDYVTRNSDGDLRPAWPRCYNLKPSRAVELEAKLAPIIQQKFSLDTAYCDVHTAVTPWSYNDYDARVPGAGTFAATFYAYGEIMLHQKKTWNGPVYSEGNNHFYYSGLTDGNYGQDQAAKLPVSPWLVDFDLRKMHPLNCNFGMGNPGMFYGRESATMVGPEGEQNLDRFLAATLAFGHTGFLVLDGGMKNAIRSYFLLQQVHANYAQEIAADIRYANERGELLDVSAAVATGAFKRSQVATTYSNGLRVVVNGHPTERWHYADGQTRHDLPPNGYFARSADGKLFVLSGEVDGHRADYADTPAYAYADGRGTFTRFAKAAGDGQVIALRRDGRQVEVIPGPGGKEFGVSLDGREAKAQALDKAGKDIGPAETRLSRGLVYVTPKPEAFSYLLTPGAAPAVALRCERDKVVPGETVVVQGRERHQWRVPADAKLGARLWQQFEGAWIDFTVMPLAAAKLTVDGQLELTLTSNLAAFADASVTLTGQTKQARLSPGKPVTLTYALERPTKDEVRPLPMTIVAGELRSEQTWWLKAEYGPKAVAALSEKYESGQCVRGGKEKGLGGESGAGVSDQAMSCGGRTKKGIFMHPPYKLGVGYSFALFEPVELPRETAAFRCWVGKRDGGDLGDGILFRVAVVDAAGRETIVAEKQWVEYAWTRLEADLSRWAGQKIRVKLISDVGPADNSSADWACWAEMCLESLRPLMALSVHETKPTLRYEVGPFPVAGLRVADLRAAKRGWLHSDGLGLQNDATYVSEAELNGVKLGKLPASVGGSETQGVWGEVGPVELPAQAIAALSSTNRLAIHNLGNDSFKLRRFWIELELADGRKCSSKIETTAYSQPGNWAYAEGVGVKFGEPIETDVVFEANP